MLCLICVSLGDVWGTVCHQNGPYVIMLDGDPRALGRDVRGRTDQVPHHLPADRRSESSNHCMTDLCSFGACRLSRDLLLCEAAIQTGLERIVRQRLTSFRVFIL
jgi:hypothetical protein